MTPDERAQLDAITDALARMVRRQDELERRLTQLEPGRPAAFRSVAPVPVALPTPPPPTTPPPPPATQRPEPRRIETAFGLTWISRIGVITVVLALAFFFEYAFENQWITVWGRVGLGLACGAVALFFGERFWRGSQRTFAQALTAAGIAFLYLSFWAAFALYHLMGRPAAFGLMLLTTAAAGALAMRYEGLAIAVLGLAGGYATPLLLGNETDQWFVLSYALLLNLGAAVAARARGWRFLEALALTGTAVVYVSQMQFPAPQGVRWAYTLFVVIYYAQFALAPLLPVAVAAQLLAGLALVQVWEPSAGVLAITLGIAVAGLAVADRRGWPTAVSASLGGFWLAYGSWRVTTGTTVPVALPLVILTAAFLAFLAWAIWRAAYRAQKLRLQDLTALAFNTAFYFGACYNLLEARYGNYEGLFAIAVAVISMAAARLLWEYDRRGALLSAGMAWALLVLAAPIQLAGYRVTLAWSLEAAALVWIGTRLHNTRVVYAAAAVFLLMLMRLALVDGLMYPVAGVYTEFLNARFLAFAVSAISLWAAAWWTRKEPRFALVAYMAGHAVLLWGASLEVVGWAERAAAPENLQSVVSASISVLLAAYAVTLVAAGVFQRHAATRIVGAGLIGMVVLKLYLYDVWLLGQFYRMAAFAILGVLLLVMSYFYSRFRGSMENWWRP